MFIGGSSAKSVFADKDPMSAIFLRFFLYQHVYISNAAGIAIEVILIKRLRRVPRAGVLSACAKLLLDEFPIVLSQVKALGFVLNPPRGNHQLKLKIVRRNNARSKRVRDARRVNNGNVGGNGFAKNPGVIGWMV